MRDKKKMMILIALIAVVGVSIGFAAFSSSLLIKSSLSVNPTGEDFKVVFSSSSTSLATNAITPSKTDSAIVADKAILNNSGTNPTIELDPIRETNDIVTTFTKPGQSVTYTFYALNTGKYDAYLTSIVFQSLSSGVFKECKVREGADKTLVANACKSIKATVTVGSETRTSEQGNLLGIRGHELKQGASETVTVTLSYESNGALADGPFTVSFGNIALTYGTQETDEMPILPGMGDTICTAVNSNNSGSTALGTEYKCQLNESTYYDFYVLSTEGTDKVNLLMSENLTRDYVPFSVLYDEEYGYWVDTYPLAGFTTELPYAMSKVEELTEDWDNISDLELSYDNGFGTYNLTGKARLPKYSEIEALCPGYGDEGSNGMRAPTGVYRYGCPDWITNTSRGVNDGIGGYWTMDYYNDDDFEDYDADGHAVWAVSSYYNTLDDFSLGSENYPDEYGRMCDYSSDKDIINNCGWNEFGIRPVITVTTADLS